MFRSLVPSFGPLFVRKMIDFCAVALFQKNQVETTDLDSVKMKFLSE